MNSISEGQMNLFAEGTHFEGKVKFDQPSRVQGIIRGEIHAQSGSTLILGETSFVEGKIIADTLLIEGFVQAEIHAQTRVVITRTGRVTGKISTPSLKVEFGAYFEGQCEMNRVDAQIKKETPPLKP